MRSSRKPSRRLELVEATRRVARAHGLQGTNLKQVAQEAGVSPAALLYYFSTKDELIEAALDAVLDEYYNHRRELVSRIHEPRERLITLIVAGTSSAANDDLRILLESVARLHIDSRFQAKHIVIAERQLSLYATTIDIGVALGVFRPRPDAQSVARNLLALEDAYSLYPLIGAGPSRGEAVRSLVSYAELALDVPLSELVPADL